MGHFFTDFFLYKNSEIAGSKEAKDIFTQYLSEANYLFPQIF